MIELTDQNFETEIKNAKTPVLVDFFAEWCQPCFILSPILEKITQDFKEKFIFKKVNLDDVPLVAQKFGIDSIPSVILFKDGKPIGGFIGLHSEPIIKEWLENILGENDNDEKFKRLIREYEDYANKNGFKLNPNLEVVNRIIKGLLENEKKYGKRYCPCRRVTGNPEEDKSKICPCQFHQEEIEKNGHCLCGLFQK